MSKFSFKSTVNSYNVEEFVEFLKLNGMSEFETVAIKKSISGHAFLDLAEFELRCWKHLIDVSQAKKFWSFRCQFEEHSENFIYLPSKPFVPSKYHPIDKKLLQKFSSSDSFSHPVDSKRIIPPHVPLAHNGQNFSPKKYESVDQGKDENIYDSPHDEVDDKPDKNEFVQKTSEALSESLKTFSKLDHDSKLQIFREQSPSVVYYSVETQDNDDHIQETIYGTPDDQEDKFMENQFVQLSKSDPDFKSQILRKEEESLECKRPTPPPVDYDELEPQYNNCNKSLINEDQITRKIQKPNTELIQEDLYSNSEILREQRELLACKRTPTTPMNSEDSESQCNEEDEDLIYEFPDIEECKNRTKNHIIQETQKQIPELSEQELYSNSEILREHKESLACTRPMSPPGYYDSFESEDDDDFIYVPPNFQEVKSLNKYRIAEKPIEEKEVELTKSSQNFDLAAIAEQLSPKTRRAIAVSALPKPPEIIVEVENVNLPDYVNQETLRPIEQESYYRDVNRRGAEQLCEGFGDGTYLVRPNRSYHGILSVKQGDKVYHIRIKKVDDNMLEMESSISGLQFKTMNEIINYYKINPILVRNKSNEIVDVYLDRALSFET